MNVKIPIDMTKNSAYQYDLDGIKFNSYDISDDEDIMFFSAYVNNCDSINVELYGNKEDIKVFKISYGGIELDECDISDELKKIILEYVDKNYAKIVKENEQFEHDETY